MAHPVTTLSSAARKMCFVFLPCKRLLQMSIPSLGFCDKRENCKNLKLESKVRRFAFNVGASSNIHLFDIFPTFPLWNMISTFVDKISYVNFILFKNSRRWYIIKNGMKYAFLRLLKEKIYHCKPPLKKYGQLT